MESNLLPQGYAYEFVPLLDRKFECPICLLCRKDTVQTKCGHRFCQECILTWLRTKEKCCPTDHCYLIAQDVVPDNCERQEILSLKVKCPQVKDGCNVVTELGQIKNHEAVCEYSLMFCPVGCFTKIYRKDIESHVEVCKSQPTVCAYCKEKFSENKKTGHNSSCPLYQISCEYCNVFICQKDKNKHIQLECPRAIVSCQFSDWGCPFSRIERQNLLKHQEKSVTTHVALLQKAVTKLTTKYAQDSNSAINNGFEAEGTQAMDCSTSGNKSTTGSNETKANLATAIPSNYESIFKAMCQKNLQLQYENQQLVNAFRFLQTTVMKQQKQIASLEEKFSQGIYYWRIQNFPAHEAETLRVGFKELKSPGFYTGPHGYRISLRTTLESKGNNNYISLSLFMHLMQGDNDDFLVWPFSGRIELCILDQEISEESSKPILETMCSNPQLAAFQRPTKECNSKGFGYKDFANSDLLRKRKYLKNDTLIIRAEVVPTMFL